MNYRARGLMPWVPVLLVLGLVHLKSRAGPPFQLEGPGADSEDWQEARHRYEAIYARNRFVLSTAYGP